MPRIRGPTKPKRVEDKTPIVHEERVLNSMLQTEKKDTNVAVVVNMKGIGKLIPAGKYRVTLKSVSAKKAANGSGNDVVTFTANINDDDAPEHLNGKPLFRTYTIRNGAEDDNSGTLFYLLQTLMSFGDDPEDLEDAGDVDLVARGNELKGNPAIAVVTIEPDRVDPKVERNRVEFKPMDYEG